MDENKAGISSRPLEQQARRVARANRQGQQRKSGLSRDRRSWEGESGAVYSRISHIKDDDQTGVARQTRISLERAEMLGIKVHPDHIFVDNNRSAWKRDRKRPGWDKLLQALREGKITHILCYHPDRLMRQPHDLEELLIIADDNDLTMHGQVNQKDLSDPDDRFILRIEVAHACRSSDDTSRRLNDAQIDMAAEGRPHVGKRRYGYTPDGMTIIEDEADIIREVFKRYLNGEAPDNIAKDLVARGIKTALGGDWSPQQVRKLLDNRHIAGLRVFRGEVLGRGIWPAIISEGLHEEVRNRRQTRSAAYDKKRATFNHRYYVLRGIVVCKRCAVQMPGSNGSGPTYVCSRRKTGGPAKCTRSIGAVKLEKYVIDAALDILEKLDPEGQVSQAVTTPADEGKIAAIEEDLTEAYEMWKAGEHTLKQYREMKRTLEERKAALQPRIIERPTAEVLAGITGPHARIEWARLEKAEDFPRMNAILRYVIAEVVIEETTTGRGRFDFSRIEIKKNPL